MFSEMLVAKIKNKSKLVFFSVVFILYENTMEKNISVWRGSLIGLRS